MTRGICFVIHAMHHINYRKKEKYKNYLNNVQFANFKYFRYTIRRRIRVNIIYALIVTQIPKEWLSYHVFFANLKDVSLVEHLKKEKNHSNVYHVISH